MNKKVNFKKIPGIPPSNNNPCVYSENIIPEASSIKALEKQLFGQEFAMKQVN